ncbi:MAG: hypothetical protein WAN86_22815, partial [Hyphomicrobiaceae bacterium]
MATEDDNFAIAVTADVSAASKAFNDLLGIIDGAAAKAGTALGKFDASLSSGSGNLLQMAAAMHPVGRTVAGLVGVLDGAVSAGRALAETFGATGAFTQFESALADLKSAVASTFNFIGDQAGVADVTGSAIRRLTELAAGAVRALQAMIESFKPITERSDTALQTQLQLLETFRVRRQRLVEQLERMPPGDQDRNAGWRRYLPDPAKLREEIAQIDALMAQFHTVMQGRIAVQFSPEAEQSLEGIREQTRQLQIQIDTFDLGTGAAARFRAELELLRHFSDEDGPRGPLFEA